MNFTVLIAMDYRIPEQQISGTSGWRLRILSQDFFENKMYIFDNVNGLFLDENGVSNSRLREFYLEKTEKVVETVE